MNAWFRLFLFAWMLETNRGGSFVAVLSTRHQKTVFGSTAFAFRVMNTRPVDVAAQIVPLSAGFRSMLTTVPPARSAPYVVPVSPPGLFDPGGPPSGL